MKKYGRMWVPSESELKDSSKHLRSIQRKNPELSFYCLFDPRDGKFIYAEQRNIEDRISNCIQIPYNLGTYDEKSWETVDAVRTEILNYVVDNSGG